MSSPLPPIWIGAKYETGGILGRRVLLVGESTYAPPGVDTFLYNRLIPTEHIDKTCRDGFRTRLVRMLLGRQEQSTSDIRAAWDSVAFFNYITVPLGGPGEAPTEVMWRLHHQPLREHLQHLRPDVVLLLSFRLWDRLTSERVIAGAPGPVLAGAGRPETILVDLGASRTVVACGVKHPSYISWQNEHGYLQRLLGSRAASPAGGSSKPRLVKRTMTVTAAGEKERPE